MEIVYPPSPAPVLPVSGADGLSGPVPEGAEMLPALDACGRVFGRMTRAYAHSGSMVLHPVVHLHLVNPRGEIYLQKRSMSKDLLPGYWDTAVGGHVGYGESIAEALSREACEELGLSDFSPVSLVSYVFTSAVESELVNVFAAAGRFDPKPDRNEVEEGRWWSAAEIREAIGKSVLTPNFESEYQRIRARLESLLQDGL